jgi:hypothetical protein
LLLALLSGCVEDTLIAEAHREVAAPPAGGPAGAPAAGSDGTVSSDAAGNAAPQDAAVDAARGGAGDAGTIPAMPGAPEASLPPLPCVEGNVVPALDPCNTCECIGGDWLCDENDCESIPVDCTPGETKNLDACDECLCDAALGWLCSGRELCEPDWGEPPCTRGARVVDPLDLCNLCECHQTLGLIYSDLLWCRQGP